MSDKTVKQPVAPTDTNKQKEELEKTKKQADEYKNHYLRALADFHNLEKRTREEKIELVRAANRDLILQLLPFLDNLNKAEIFVKDAGLKMVKEHFEKFLQEIGIVELQLIGQEFNPQVAEAVELVEGPKDNMVVEILRKGYQLNGKVLRPAQVKVSRKKN